jgi:hypothetical protein
MVQALQDAGCFAVVLECLPPVVAEALTKELTIPTIGIGAGPHCSGQVHTLSPFYISKCFHNVGLVSRHQVPATQVSSVQTGLFRAPRVEQFDFAMSESL